MKKNNKTVCRSSGSRLSKKSLLVILVYAKKNYEHSSFYIETFIFNKALTATKLQFRNNNLLKNSTEFRKTIFIANNFLSFSSLKYELLDKFS